MYLFLGQKLNLRDSELEPSESKRVMNDWEVPLEVPQPHFSYTSSAGQSQSRIFLNNKSSSAPQPPPTLIEPLTGATNLGGIPRVAGTALAQGELPHSRHASVSVITIKHK